jgi:hypothetical protein
MPTHVELYEALKPFVGAEAAQLMAEVIPPTGELATKSDLATDFARLEAKISEVEARLSQKLLTYFIPLWVMMGSMALAIVGLVATRL